MQRSTLVIIPARGGSKGIPGKNTKLLQGTPLIHYSIRTALHFFNSDDICVSTDDPAIRNVAEATGIEVPFLRPAEMATDQAGPDELVHHALDFYAQRGRTYQSVLYLQPTSPFRLKTEMEQAMREFHTHDYEHLIGVIPAKANPYYVLFEENTSGELTKVKEAHFATRQECPEVWQINGALYWFKTDAFRQKKSIGLLRKTKFTMNELYSIDLDTPVDWAYAEFLIEKGYVDPQLL